MIRLIRMAWWGALIAATTSLAPARPTGLPSVGEPALMQEEGDNPWLRFISVLEPEILKAVSAEPIPDLDFPPVPHGTPDLFALTVGGGGGVADGPTLQAGFNLPTGLDVDAAGNLYIADTLNHRIRVFNRQGVSITVAGVSIPPGQVKTVAGTGKAGFSGDGGPALLAELNSPGIAAVDASGNIYFARRQDPTPRIRKVSTTGTITPLAGTGTVGFSGDGGPATASSFSRFRDMLVLGSLLIVPDDTNRRVRAINIGAAPTTLLGVTIAPGAVNTIIGNGASGNTGDGSPAGAGTTINPHLAALDKDSNLCIASEAGAVSGTFTYRFRVVNLSGASKTYYPSAGAGTVTVAPGVIQTIAGGGTDSFTNGILYNAARIANLSFDFDGSDNIWFDDILPQFPATLACRLRRIDGSTGTVTTVGGSATQSGFAGALGGASSPVSSALFTFLIGLRATPSGDVFLTDSRNNIFRSVTGAVTQIVAGNGFIGASGDDALSYTASVRPRSARAIAGKTVTADQGNNRVFTVGANGRLQTLVGKGVRGESDGALASALMTTPADIAFHPSDPGGNLIYVAETGDFSVVRLINNTASAVTIGSVSVPPGEVKVVAGTGSSGAGIDGPQTTVALNTPTGVDVDSNGLVYILDSLNGKLRVLNPGPASATAIGTTVASGEVRTVSTVGIGSAMVRIRKFDSFGNPLNDVFLAETNQFLVRRITQANVSTSQGLPGRPLGLTIKPDGTLFVAAGNQILDVDIDGGTFPAVAGSVGGFGGDGGLAINALFLTPMGLDLEPAPPPVEPPGYRILIADNGNGRIRRIDPPQFAPGAPIPLGTVITPIPGVEITFSGGGTAGPTGFVSVVPSADGPPPPPDFRLSGGGKDIWFDISGATIAGNALLKIFWHGEWTGNCDEFPPPAGPNIPKLFQFKAGIWSNETTRIDCAAEFTSARVKSFSIFKVFGNAFIPLNIAIKPKQVMLDGGVYAAFVTVDAPFAASDIDVSSLRDNGASPVTAVLAPQRVVTLFRRDSIEDLGDGTGLIVIRGTLKDGSVIRGEAIVPVK